MLFRRLAFAAGFTTVLFINAAYAGTPLDVALERVYDAGAPAVPGGAGAAAPWLVPGGAPGLYAAHLLSPLQNSGRLRLRAGFAWRDGSQRNWSLDGSLVAMDLGDGELYASVERRHWGPGWVGSLILDGSAPALPAMGWRRDAATASDSAMWRWLGPWSADVFLGQLRGHREPARPWLMGMRATFEPISGLRLGLSRTIQWGGDSRDQSPVTLLRALLGRDNVGDSGIDRSNEPGNQLAGIDWRWTPDRSEVPRGPSFYGQVVGEDEAGLLPSRNMVLLGLDWAATFDARPVRLFVEAADTFAGDAGSTAYPGAAYRHHAFRQGYTHEGVVLGHPAGGDMRLVSTGALVQHGAVGAMAVLSFGRALPSATRFVAGAAAGMNLAAHVDVDHQQRMGVGLWWWRDPLGTRAAAQLWWQHRHR